MLQFPSKEKLEYKEQDFFLELNEQWKRSSKFWFVFLVVVIVCAIPSALFLSGFIAGQKISSYQPPHVSENPLNPQDLQVEKIDILPVTSGVYSSYAQVINPNPEISAWQIDYSFIYRDASGLELGRKSGNGYVLSGESKFLVEPAVELVGEPTEAEIVFEKIRWTKRVPDFYIKLGVLAERSGNFVGGNFFVEAQVKNLEDLRIKEVGVVIIVFNQRNQAPLAINKTFLTHLNVDESRFFRVVWPRSYDAVGNIQIFPEVNPFDPGLMLENKGVVPQR